MILKKNINILYLKGLLCHRRRRYSIQKRRQRSSLHLVLQIVLTQISLFFKSSWFKIASAARNWSSFVPQEAATTFAFFFCINPSSMFCVYLLPCQRPHMELMHTGHTRHIQHEPPLQLLHIQPLRHTVQQNPTGTSAPRDKRSHQRRLVVGWQQEKLSVGYYYNICNIKELHFWTFFYCVCG